MRLPKIVRVIILIAVGGAGSVHAGPTLTLSRFGNLAPGVDVAATNDSEQNLARVVPSGPSNAPGTNSITQRLRELADQPALFERGRQLRIAGIGSLNDQPLLVAATPWGRSPGLTSQVSTWASQVSVLQGQGPAPAAEVLPDGLSIPGRPDGKPLIDGQDQTASPTGQFVDLFGAPMIGKDGEIVFFAMFEGPDGRSAGPAVVSQRHAMLVPGKTDKISDAESFRFGPSVAADGRLLVVSGAGEEGHFLGPEGELPRAGSTIDGLTFQALGLPTMNSAGTVAFLAITGDNAQCVATAKEVLARTGQEFPVPSQSGPFATSTDADPGQLLLTEIQSSPWINAAGEIAFIGKFAFTDVEGTVTEGQAVFAADRLRAWTGSNIGGVTPTEIVTPLNPLGGGSTDPQRPGRRCFPGPFRKW